MHIHDPAHVVFAQRPAGETLMVRHPALEIATPGRTVSGALITISNPPGTLLELEAAEAQRLIQNHSAELCLGFPPIDYEAEIVLDQHFRRQSI